jgi:hypothetical protein
MNLIQKFNWKPVWKITKYDTDINSYNNRDEFFKNNRPYDEVIIDGNIMLNTGINEVWDLVTGAGGTAFDNSNAKLGVGDSATAESAAHTGLQAVTNKFYRAMDPGYPTSTSQKVTFVSSFGGAEANYAWNEFCVNNGATDESTGVRLNRKVSAQGTKTNGQTWILTLEITLS